jgi:putative transposase
MTDYRRNYFGDTYFFTVNINNRREPLLTENIDILRASFKEAINHYPFTIDAIVVLPDHLHCIWTLPFDDKNYSRRWRLIKSYFSKQMPVQKNISQSQLNKREKGVWQRRFWEHTIRDEEDYFNHINYIHNNPLKHGYCDDPRDWPYSSIHKTS